MPKILFFSGSLSQTRFVTTCRFTLGLLFWFVFAVCFLAPAKAAGPLSVGSSNPRFFVDSNGKAVYLTGVHLSNNLVDRSDKAILDFRSYLNFLQQYDHNFVRLWAWEQAAWSNESNAKITFDLLPYQRRGPGTALDGGRKFDLSRFNQAYFDRLRSRVVEAGERGIYVSVMLFQGFSSQRKTIGGGNPWTGHPFNLSNNVNGINGDPSGNDNGEEVHSLIVPAITSLQEAYVRKVVDTLNDLDNVLYEISGDAPSSSREWQYHMINYLKNYQTTKPKRHPVGMSYLYLGSANDLLASPADWILLPGSDTNPPLAAGDKVIFSDMDPKLLGSSTSYPMVWKSFMRGFNPIYLESGLTNPSADENVRRSMGYALKYSQLVDLSSMLSSSELCSSGFCLIKLGLEYLVYLPSGGTVRVDLSAAHGSFVASWFSPLTGQTTAGDTVSAGIPVLLTSPINGDAVLHLQAMPALSNQSSDTSLGLSSSDTIQTTAAQTSSLSISNAGPVTVTQGSSATTTITANLAAGSRRRSISFSVSGLPKGVYAAFFPNSCTPNCSTQLKLTASSSAAVGSYTINVTGKNRQYEGTTSFTLSVAQPSTAAVNAPTITPNGGAFSNSVTVTLQTSTSGASIYYTMDGSLPTQSSKQYSAPFSLTATSLVKAQAFKSGMTPSSQVSAWFSKDAVFDFSLSNTGNKWVTAGSSVTNTISGTLVSGSTQPVIFSASGLPSGASASYASASCSPACSSTLTINTASTTPTGSYPVTVTGTGGGFVRNTNFTLTVNPAPTPPPPSGIVVASPTTITFQTTAGGSLPSPQSIMVTVPGGGRWSTNDTSPFYDASAACWVGAGGSCASGSVTTLTPNPSFFQTAAAGTYSAPLTISSTGYPNLVVPVTLTITGGSTTTVASPTISPNGGSFTGSVSITLQTVTSGASIYYTTNGSTPTQSSTLYTGPMTLTSSATVKAAAFKSGSNPSAQASANFTLTSSGGAASLTNECSNPQAGWIWCDDFETNRLGSYFEYDNRGGDFVPMSGLGVNGSSGMRVIYRPGQSSAGGMKLAFGSTPDPYFRAVDAGTAKYREVYWRMYVKNQTGWTGGGADKLSRAIAFANNNWAEAAIGHVWSGSSGSAQDYLFLDPASGTDTAGNLLTTGYNDTTHFRWLGAQQGTIPLFNSSNVGQWHCVETHMKLNNAGQSDGLFEFWVDGNLNAQRTGLNWLGSYANFGINAIFFENYWNATSPVVQERYFDNIVVSTQPIGCGSPTAPAPFDFSLSNTGNKSVTAGSSVANAISGTLVSGSTQPVTFSASGLPSGVSTSYSSASCNPACSTTLTINTAAATPTGSYTVTVTGTGGGVSRTTNFVLTVNPASALPPPSGVVASPTTITFQTNVGGTLPSPQSIAVTVPGGGRWSTNDTSPFYNASIACWSGAGGSCASGSVTTLTPNPSFFQTAAAGTYSAPLTISSTGYPNLVVPVTLTITGGSTTTVASPTISPNGGSFTGSVSITLQTVTSGASIYYTTNGSTPTQSSTLYTGPMTLTSSATVKAAAFKSGSNPSAVASASFTVVTPPAQLTLTWQDNSTNENNFGVEKKTGTNGTYAQIALMAANITSYVDTGVTHGVTYCYRVRAINSAGASAYTNEFCATAP